MRRFTLSLLFLVLLLSPVKAYDNAGDIVDEIQRRLFRDPDTITSEDIFSSTQCMIWIDNTTLELAREMPVEALTKLLTINTCDVVTGQNDYALPNDETNGYFLRYVGCRVDCLINSTTTLRRYWCTKIPVSEVKAKELSPAYEPTEKSPYLYLWNDSINIFYDRNYTGLISTPTTNAGIELYFIRRPDPIKADSDIPDFDKSLYEMLVIGSLIKAYQKIKDFNSAIQMQKLWDAKINTYHQQYAGLEVQKK